VTLHRMVHGCGHFVPLSRSRRRCHSSAAKAGSMPAWAPLRSDRQDGTCPAEVRQRNGERDRHRSDFGCHRSMPATRQCQPEWPKRRERSLAGGRSRIDKVRPCNRVRPLSVDSDGKPKASGAPAAPRSLPQDFGSGRVTTRPDRGSEPVLGGVGARAHLLLLWVPRAKPSRRGQGRPEAKREAKPGDEAELVEASAEPNIAAAAPRSVP
jgi:hypothetical protein